MITPKAYSVEMAPKYPTSCLYRTTSHFYMLWEFLKTTYEPPDECLPDGHTHPFETA